MHASFASVNAPNLFELEDDYCQCGSSEIFRRSQDQPLYLTMLTRHKTVSTSFSHLCERILLGAQQASQTPSNLRFNKQQYSISSALKTMAPSPPTPEAPKRNNRLSDHPTPEQRHRRNPSNNTTGTPRVGMHLIPTDDDDDVSVLTFSTMTTKDTVGTYTTSKSFVETARQSLEKLMIDDIAKQKNEGDSPMGKETLSHISEEAGSQRSHASSKKMSQYHESSNEEDNNDDVHDDDTLSLAESILDSANQVLRNIGSSPYLAGRVNGKGRHSFGSCGVDDDTVKERIGGNENANSMNNVYSRKSGTEKNASVSEKALVWESKRAAAANSENENSNSANVVSVSKCSGSNKNVYKNNATTNNMENTHQLQIRLREKQLEITRAMKVLDLSIQKASELL